MIKRFLKGFAITVTATFITVASIMCIVCNEGYYTSRPGAAYCIPNAYDIDEYNTKMNDLRVAPLPYHTIPYSQVSFLGEFRLSGSLREPGFGGVYDYLLEDSSYLCEVDVFSYEPFIEPHTDMMWLTLSDLPEDMTDMRDLNLRFQDTFFMLTYYKHGARYLYNSNGNLYGILWKHDHRYIFLGIRLYPVNERNTILSRLLSKDEKVSGAAFWELRLQMELHRPFMQWATLISLCFAIAMIPVMTLRRLREENQQSAEQEIELLPLCNEQDQSTDYLVQAIVNEGNKFQP